MTARPSTTWVLALTSKETEEIWPGSRLRGPGRPLKPHPPLRGMGEILGARRSERSAARLPFKAYDLNAWMLDAQQIEGITFASAAGGGGGARADDERAVSRYRVALGGVPGMASMKMAREQHVYATVGKRFHRL